MKKSTFDVVIVGAGIAGITTAYYLATRHNITHILLVDKRPPMTYTSDKSGSNYRNWWPHPAMAQLANHSINLMDELANETHNIFNMNRRGYAYFSRHNNIDAYLSAYAQSDVGEIRIHHKTANTYQPDENPALSGADVLVGNSLIKRYAPFISDDIQSMVHIRRAGWISTRVMAQHMLDAASQSGLVEMRGEVVSTNQSENGYEVHIDTPHGQQIVTTTKVLWTIGPDFVPNQAKIGLADVPITNVFHQKVMMQDNGAILPDGMPFMIFTGSPSCDWTDEELAYLHTHVQSDQIPGNFHIRRVNNRWIHLGWAFNNVEASATDDIAFEPLFPQAVAKGLSSFIPSLKPYGETMPHPYVVSGGFYTRTLENLPIIQQTQSGMYTITGLSGFGVMMGCGLGEIMSRMIAEQDVPDYVQHFSATRYNDPTYMQQLEALPSGEL